VREVTLYDTRTRRVTPLVPRDPGNVGIYACGPTVYSRIHVGNARPYVVFSWLKRFLEHEGYGVTFVANVTDINDKIYDAARAQGRDSAELAAEMARLYVQDTDRLGIGRPDAEPYASEYIEPIVDLIGALLEGGHAYVAGGDVYFRVRSLDGYGSLSHRDIEQMDQGEGLEGAELKEDPLDFALWKAHKPGEDTHWHAPWGDGRPGWHIECSAMAERLLGLEFDVHGGGIDLAFPHHENEAAQTRAGRGAELAKLWVHNGLLELTGEKSGERPGEKMSKSVGNIRTLADVLDAYGAEALLVYFAGGHYRQPIAFSAERMEDAVRTAERIREAGRKLLAAPSPDALAPHRDAFFDALADDFNTPEALAALFAWIRDANRAEEAVGNAHLLEMLGIFGLESLLAAEEDAPPEAWALAERRTAARAAREWAEADRLRDELRGLGWEVRDGPDGPELVRA
jgi:cysteinyl-tRNA synthetase